MILVQNCTIVDLVKNYSKAENPIIEEGRR